MANSKISVIALFHLLPVFLYVMHYIFLHVFMFGSYLFYIGFFKVICWRAWIFYFLLNYVELYFIWLLLVNFILFYWSLNLSYTLFRAIYLLCFVSFPPCYFQRKFLCFIIWIVIIRHDPSGNFMESSKWLLRPCSLAWCGHKTVSVSQEQLDLWSELPSELLLLLDYMGSHPRC